MPKKDIALAMKISRMALWKIEQNYKKYGEDGLKDHKPGKLFEPLNATFYKKIVDARKKLKYGARKLHAYFKQQGFKVSQRKIKQTLEQENLIKPCPKRRGTKKYKSYEWPLLNWMWHTDYYELKDGKWLIPFIDDFSRKVMGYGIFKNATTRNALLVLYHAIADHLVIPVELNSDKGSQFFASKRNKKGEAEHEFEQALEELGILFIPSRRGHPQTNGKTERFFGIFQAEYDERFKSISEFIEFYNTERLSESKDYMTPNEAYRKGL